MNLSRIIRVIAATGALFAMVATAIAVPPPPTAVSGKEYSNFMDENAIGMPDSEQAIFWTGTGTAFDTFDYTPPPGPGPARVPDIFVERPETDALAFDQDRYFFPLRANTRDLIFSTDGDPRIHFEDTAGAGGVWALPGTINMMFPPDDVDAIEVWGPDSTAAASRDDAFNYSLESSPLPMGPGAFDPGMVSVWHVAGSAPGTLGPTAFPLLFVPEIAAAIFPLAPAGTPIDVIQNELDLDGMMLNIEEFEPDSTGGAGGLRVGSIHFTIDPIVVPGGPVIFDGGEIFTWDFAFPGPVGPAAFLFHGGHLWDTAFPVAAMFGTPTENVNGIESVPEPASAFLAALGLVAWWGSRRKR